MSVTVEWRDDTGTVRARASGPAHRIDRVRSEADRQLDVYLAGPDRPRAGRPPENFTRHEYPATTEDE